MKHVLLSTLALLLSVSAFAQKSGTVQYQQVMKLDFQAPEGMEEMFKNMPKERVTEKELIFHEEASLYRNPEDKIGDEDKMITMGGDDFQIKMDFQEPEELLYKNYNDDTYTHQQDFMGKTFLVTGNAKKQQWKVGKDKKKIADYICISATTVVSDTVNVTAWFTPQIPISRGPGSYSGLPGLILQVDYNDGQRVTTAQSVELTAIAPEDIVAPSKGKKITKEKYDKVVEEKMAEMKAAHGGKGNMVIEIRQ